MTAPDPAMPKNCFVYGIAVDDGSGPVLRYVGKATRLKRSRWCRFKQHMWEARNLIELRKQGHKPRATKLCSGLAKAIRLGHEIFKVIIGDGFDDETAFQLERQLIEGMSPDLRWNLREGGEGFTSADAKKIWECEEHRRRMSEAGRGRTHTEEARRKLSEAAKGRTHTEEHRRKNSEAQKGRIPSAETLRKRSEAMKGRSHTEEHRRKNSEAKKGRALTEEHRRKLCEARRRRKIEPMKGRTHTEEARRKMSANSPLVRAVCTPAGVFRSVTEAAAAHGIGRDTAWKRANNQRHGWYFADEKPKAQAIAA